MAEAVTVLPALEIVFPRDLFFLHLTNLELHISMQGADPYARDAVRWVPTPAFGAFVREAVEALVLRRGPLRLDSRPADST